VGDSLLTAGILAVVALSEGVRVVPFGALVLERPFGRWRIARTFELGSGMHLVSWCIPYTLPALLSSAPIHDVAGETGRVRERFATVESRVRTTRVFGGLILLVLVVGLPYSASHWSGLGLLGALALLLGLSVAQMLTTRTALRDLGEPAGGAWRLLWPFSAPRAPQMLQERAFAGFSPTLVAHALLDDDDFLRSMRPLVYDATHTLASSSDILALYDRATLRAFIERPVAEDGQPYCPRCAALYRAGTARCSDCDAELATAG